jgi:hypothetical protein
MDCCKACYLSSEAKFFLENMTTGHDTKTLRTMLWCVKLIIILIATKFFEILPNHALVLQMRNLAKPYAKFIK